MEMDMKNLLQINYIPSHIFKCLGENKDDRKVEQMYILGKGTCGRKCLCLSSHFY